MGESLLTEAAADTLIGTCRTVIGDDLRSITYFTVDDYEQVYLRSDLERDANLDRFAENERLGFTSLSAYGESELGEYLFTIRTFEHGYITRVIVGEHGVFVTTDEISIDRFEELAAALKAVLRSY